MEYRSGKLKKVVEVLRSTTTKNAYGEESTVWNTYKSVRADIINYSGYSGIDNSEMFDFQNTRIQIRKQIDLLETDRLRFNGNIYVIEFIQFDPTDRWLYIKCSKLNE